MNRMLRNSFAFLFGFFVVALPILAFAETTPATTGPLWYEQNGAYGTSYSSAQSACDAIANRKYAQTWTGTSWKLVTPTAVTVGQTGITAWCESKVTDSGYYQNNWSGNVYMFSGAVCPSGQNWTLNGQTCTRPDCVAPETRQPDGTCSRPQCTYAANAQVGGMYVIPRPVPSGVIWCANNCLVYMVTDSYSPTETFAKAYVNGAGMAASSCTGGGEVVPSEKSPEPTKTPTPCAAGQGVITNSAGKVVCVDQGEVPSSEKPKVNKSTETKTHPDGSQTINNTTQTCTGEGACSTTTTTTITNATNGQPGIAGTPGTTNSVKDKPAETQSDLCAQNPSLQICKGGMATEALQTQTLDEIKKLNNPTVSDDSPITSKTFESTTGRADLTTHDDSLKNYVMGAVVPGEVATSKGAWEAAMSSGWFDPIERGGCQPYVASIGGKTWTWDYCQKADEIAQIGAYCLWFSLLVGVFVMLTGGQRS